MKVLFHKNFKKQYKELRISEQRRCDERITLFIRDTHHPILNNHLLGGEYKNFRSINITGNLRALFELADKNIALFIMIDTHSNLYS